jgi:hypothetical protein
MHTSQPLENDITEIDDRIDLFIGCQILILSGSPNRSKFNVIIRQLSQTLKDVSACLIGLADFFRTEGFADEARIYECGARNH